MFYLLPYMFVPRTTKCSSEETQKDLHCENGWYEEPVEEHCRPVRQLVSVKFMQMLEKRRCL